MLDSPFDSNTVLPDDVGSSFVDDGFSSESNCFIFVNISDPVPRVLGSVNFCVYVSLYSINSGLIKSGCLNPDIRSGSLIASVYAPGDWINSSDGNIAISLRLGDINPDFSAKSNCSLVFSVL